VSDASLILTLTSAAWRKIFESTCTIIRSRPHYAIYASAYQSNQ
jgi:hypothetical protein